MIKLLSLFISIKNGKKRKEKKDELTLSYSMVTTKKIEGG